MRRARLASIALVLAAAVAGGGCFPEPEPLDPNLIPMYVEPLTVPPVMEPYSRSGELTEYRIAAKQIRQQVLPSSLPKTTVWAYGRFGEPASFHYPGYTVEVRRDERVRVWWINQLLDARGHYLPHLFPVDQTLHWANPPGPADMRGTSQEPYTGPVPLVTHVHGAHVPSISDGLPEAWWLPPAINIPRSYVRRGSDYGSVLPAPQGAAAFEYPNDQRASTLWYHDHTLGITRLNVYAGLAGFWLIRDAVEDALGLPGPAPALGDDPDRRYYEIPIAIQDRTFNTDGSLLYPDSRADFDGFTGPYRPESDVPPIWNPEFFGNVMVVNGSAWPHLEVEPRLYRLRLLNGCNSRFLILKLDRPGLDFVQIGNEGGTLPDHPVTLSQILMGPAERADVLVDFSGLRPGETVTVLNLGPDEPFQGPGAGQAPADPATTGQVMQFRVVARTSQGRAGRIPDSLPPIAPLTEEDEVRDLTLNEEVSSIADIPVAALLGTAAQGPLFWDDPVTETPRLNDTETWRLINLTMDSHPIHLHLVQFQVLDRTPFDAEAFRLAQQKYLEGGGGAPPDPVDFATGPSMPPAANEEGRKDTVIANPGEVTRIRATFDLPGRYVWHCHILEHEDNEMMRPYVVLPLGDEPPGPMHLDQVRFRPERK